MEKKTKVVNLDTKIEDKKPAKLTYEQLEEVAHQLSNRVNQLSAQLSEAVMINASKRLDYLFKTLEYKDLFSKEFITSAISEIEEALTSIEEEQNVKE